MTYTLISDWKDWKVDKALPTIECMEAYVHKNTFFFHPGIRDRLCDEYLSFVVAGFQRFNLSSVKPSEKCCRNDLFKV